MGVKSGQPFEKSRNYGESADDLKDRLDFVKALLALADIAIIGEPGSGKTTRLQKIADWILEQDLGLPIWVSLADLTQATITQYIKEIWLTQTKSLTIDELIQHKERIWLGNSKK
ncbi:hypothetical protein [Oscillatoria sp. HE19RPO]|uniref:hypothetical protein n=1 Tax=Oscillatoria sp. HE19RPO TaxID=2954806 RepID=UPI0020C2E22B|nr:hypothetical protein [Oscillatoria sp. HE19RPO]